MGIKTVTALTALACVAALTLSACGPKADAPKSDSSSGGVLESMFPKRTANYMAKYTLTSNDRTIDQTHYGSGAKRRMEFNIAGRNQVTLMDPDTQTFLAFATGPNAPKTAMKLDANALKQANQYEVDENAPTKPKKVGSDTVAGEKCTLWEATAPATDGEPAPAPLQMCVTDDGIMLRVGPADKPQMVATEVKRGAQDPKLFQLPEGYTVVDLGECMTIMQAYAESMRNGGAKPDQAKFMECQKKMMSGMGAP
jgi:hypothetical protein